MTGKKVAVVFIIVVLCIVGFFSVNKIPNEEIIDIENVAMDIES
ncbi:MAG: hypothetical protein Q4D65_07605 [Peptostreptococcaceae bacterium]|nr:hypothetical protein [Peptostreptococcaceae bacterium]